MKTVLQFSGGRDSIALLYLMEPFWDGIEVVWANSKDPSDELMALMAEVQALVPHFMVACGDAKAYRAEQGEPTGRSWMRCCGANIWNPMAELMRVKEVKTIIRGSKKVDPMNVIAPNHVDVNGAMYMMPLWDWTDEKVEGYITGRALKPVYPHDCATCPVSKPCDRPELVR